MASAATQAAQVAQARLGHSWVAGQKREAELEAELEEANSLLQQSAAEKESLLQQSMAERQQQIKRRRLEVSELQQQLMTAEGDLLRLEASTSALVT